MGITYAKVFIVEVVIVELGQNQYQYIKPASVQTISSNKRLGYNRPGYDHLHVVLCVTRERWEERFYTPPPPGSSFCDCKCARIETTTPIWLRTNGVNTNGAAANKKLILTDWGKVRPGTFGKII